MKFYTNLVTNKFYTNLITTKILYKFITTIIKSKVDTSQHVSLDFFIFFIFASFSLNEYVNARYRCPQKTEHPTTTEDVESTVHIVQLRTDNVRKKVTAGVVQAVKE